MLDSAVFGCRVADSTGDPVWRVAAKSAENRSEPPRATNKLGGPDRNYAEEAES